MASTAKFLFPLRLKLLFFLLVLSVTSLGIYGFILIRDFQRDKISSIFESTMSESKSISVLLRNEFELSLEPARKIIDQFSLATGGFTPEARQRFQHESRIQHLAIYLWNSEKQAFELKEKLQKDELRRPASSQVTDRDLLRAARGKIVIRPRESSEAGWNLTLLAAAQPQMVADIEFSRGAFRDEFYGAKLQNNYLIDDRSEVVIGHQQAGYSIQPSVLTEILNQKLERKGLDFGTMQVKTASAEEFLVSFSSVGIADLSVLSVIPLEVAQQVLTRAKAKSWVFLIFLLSLATIAGVLGARRLTLDLQMLHSAVAEVAQGNLDVSVTRRSQDEVGDLIDGFNRMTVDLKRLMQETAETERMSGELRTAQLIQSTLFPEHSFATPNIRLRGHYQPASECSGDWWTHFQMGSVTFLGLADATGHGVAAALMTSAARAATSVLRREATLSVKTWQAGLNQAIFECSQGQMQMTSFLCAVDEQGLLTSSNASHEPAWLLRAAQRPLDRHRIELVAPETGRRLGEAPEGEFAQSSVQMQPGDVLFLFTDGLTELENPSGQALGERQLLRVVVDRFNAGASADDLVSTVSTVIRDHTAGVPLKDDITFIFLQYGRT